MLTRYLFLALVLLFLTGGDYLRRTGDPSIYPDLRLTPGEIDPAVTQANLNKTICKPGYSKKVRPPVSVTRKIKAKVMAAYGDTDDSAHYELDHLISLELGGSPASEKNLWPEPYGDKNHPLMAADKRTKEMLPGAHQKDLVENFLHKQVCEGEIKLKDAQGMIKKDWYSVYEDHFGAK